MLSLKSLRIQAVVALFLTSSIVGVAASSTAADAQSAAFFAPPAGSYADFLSFSSGGQWAFFCSHPLTPTGQHGFYAASILGRKAHLVAQTRVTSCSASSIPPASFIKTNRSDTFGLFSAEITGNTGTQLWLVTLEGATPTLRSVSGVLPANQGIIKTDISPDGRWILYALAQQPYGAIPRTMAVYIAPSDGSTAPQLLPGVPARTGVHVLVNGFSPDSQSVLSNSDESSGALYTWDLFSIAINGNSHRRLTPSPCGTGALNTCSGPVTADSRYAIVNVPVAANGYDSGVYRVLLEAEAPTWQRVTEPLTLSPQLTAGDQNGIGVVQNPAAPDYLLSFATDGSRAPQHLPDPMPASSQGVSLSHPYQLGCGRTCVVFLVDNQNSGQGMTLYRSPVDGSAQAQLIFTVPPASTGPWAGLIRDNLRTFALSPEGGRVVWSVDAQDHSALDLYAAPLTGSSDVTHITQWSTQGGSTDDWTPLIGGSFVVAMDPATTSADTHSLVRYSTVIADGSPVTLANAVDFRRLIGVPDGRHVVALGMDGAFYLVDALGDQFLNIFLPSLQR